MPELARARSRVDAETVAPERRTPAVPITRFSYDRNAMRAARSARTRMGAPAPAGPAAFAPTDPAPPGLAVRRAVASAPAAPAVVPPEVAAPAAEPIFVVACVADYSGARAVPPVPITRSPAAAAAPPAPSRPAGRPSILSAPAPVRAVPEPAARPVLDPVAARAAAAEADARLRAVALARRAASLQERLATEVGSPGRTGAAPAGRPRLLRRAVGA